MPRLATIAGRGGGGWARTWSQTTMVLSANYAKLQLGPPPPPQLVPNVLTVFPDISF